MATVETPPPGAPKPKLKEGTFIFGEDGEQTITVTDRMLEETRDALLVLEYAVSTACQQKSDIEVPQKVEVGADIMLPIKNFAAVVKVDPGAGEEARPTGYISIPVGMWVKFEVAYNSLAKLVAPVTAQTLRNTEESKTGRFFARVFSGASPAAGFSRLLGFTTTLFALLTLTGEFWFLRYGVADDGQVDWQNDIGQVFEVIVPFLYGGLGACAFLLRSAHRYIHERTFDLRRRAEYWNRILLGSVSGGSIILFISGDVIADDGAFRLSTAALGFLAGYSTDFLFSTVERIAKVLLPKVDISTMRRAAEKPPATPAPDLSLKDLMDRYAAATEPDTKALIKALIKQLYKADV